MRAAPLSVLSALTAFAIACGDASDVDSGAGESSDALVVPAAARAGTLAYGGAVDVAYTSTPRYRAYSFVADAGDEIEANATSSDGDAVLWLTNASFGTLIKNDDADATTTNARITRKLSKGGTYWLVVSEAKRKASALKLSLAKKGVVEPPPPTTSSAVFHPCSDGRGQNCVTVTGKCVDLYACPVQGFTKVEGFINFEARYDGDRLEAVPIVLAPGTTIGATTRAASEVEWELVRRGYSFRVDGLEHGAVTTSGRNDVFYTATRTSAGADVQFRVWPGPGSEYANQSMCSTPQIHAGGYCSLHVNLP